MLQFFRETQIELLMKSPDANRGFFVSLRAGFVKAIDPDSGMSVNLVLVDLWLAELKTKFQDAKWSDFDEALRAFRQELVSQAQSHQAQLSTLELFEPHSQLTWMWSLANHDELILRQSFDELDTQSIVRTYSYEVCFRGHQVTSFSQSDLRAALVDYVQKNSDLKIEAFLRANEQIRSIQMDLNRTQGVPIKWQLSSRDF